MKTLSAGQFRMKWCPISNRPQNRPLMSAWPRSVPSHGKNLQQRSCRIRADDAEDFSFLDFKKRRHAAHRLSGADVTGTAGAKSTSRRSPWANTPANDPVYGRPSP